MTIKETNYGLAKRGFSSLINSLDVWQQDEKNKTVQLRFPTYLPKSDSKVIFVYDKGFTAFEKYADVVSVSTFPYRYQFQNQLLVEINYVDKDGDIYFIYKGRKIELKPGQSYQTFGFSDFHLTKTIIQNFGFYKKNNFTLFNAKK